MAIQQVEGPSATRVLRVSGTAFLLLMLSAITLFGLTACGNETDKNETSLRDVKKETGEAVETAKEYTKARKQQYEARMAEQIRELEEKVVELNRKAVSARAEAKAEMKQEAEALQQDLDTLRGRYDKLKTATGDAWTDVKTGIDEAIKNLKSKLQDEKAKLN